MKDVAFIPVKLNNERVPGKNIKCFSDGTPLMALIQKTLLECNEIDEVYCYCSNKDVCDFLLEGVNRGYRLTFNYVKAYNVLLPVKEVA